MRFLFLLYAVLFGSELLAATHGALDATRLGLYDGADFRLVDGRCADCATIPQAIWYFRGDLVAVPRSSPAGFVPRLTVQEDVRAWRLAHPDGDQSRPPLLWMGAPLVAQGARLADGGRTLVTQDGKRLAFSVVPKIDTNLSYYDDSSVRHFAERRLRMRGKVEDGRFVARTLWPEDYALDPARVPYQPLRSGETLDSLVRADEGGARLPLAARTLWRRDGAAAQPWAGKAVLGVMLNGAQGDDDEAHAGHFAIVTGAFGPRGEWGDLLVNNFYNLDSVSEKGIIAATLPLDNYMADLNSGQSWYRPSYMLVAVLRQERAARIYQEAVGRVYNHFYRHDFSYRHASVNCAGISMETLRAIGWQIPTQGPGGRVRAALALPYMAVKERSLESGRSAYDYLSAEVTNLYPFVAFLAAGEQLLGQGTGGRDPATAYERMLAQDLEALIFVRIPQFPSSRAFGQAPVASLDEYMKRAPEDKSQWKIIPVAPRPFPAELKDAEAPAEPLRASAYAVFAYGAVLFLFAVWTWRRRAVRKSRRQGRGA